MVRRAPVTGRPLPNRRFPPEEVNRTVRDPECQIREFARRIANVLAHSFEYGRHALQSSCHRANALGSRSKIALYEAVADKTDAVVGARARFMMGEVNFAKKNYDENKLDKFWADIMAAGLSHPFPIWRVAEILEWVDSGQYQDLMKKE